MSDWMYERGLLVALVAIQLGWIGAISWGAARVAGLI